MVLSRAIIVAHGKPVGRNANWSEKNRVEGRVERVEYRNANYGFLHYSGEDWCDGYGPRVGILYSNTVTGATCSQNFTKTFITTLYFTFSKLNLYNLTRHTLTIL